MKFEISPVLLSYLREEFESDSVEEILRYVTSDSSGLIDYDGNSVYLKQDEDENVVVGSLLCPDEPDLLVSKTELTERLAQLLDRKS